MRSVDRFTGWFFVAGLLLVSPQAGAVQVNFAGELMDLPCQIAPESRNQEVVFLQRPAKDFWFAPARAPVKNFTIRLMACDASSMQKTVKLKFSGQRESNMTGQSDYYLRVSGINQGLLGIGLLDTDGSTPLKLGTAHNKTQGSRIEGTSVLLTFGAVVQATPQAIANKRVQPGEYSAVANFELSYE